jgi:hypothetical protein
MGSSVAGCPACGPRRTFFMAAVEYTIFWREKSGVPAWPLPFSPWQLAQFWRR